MRERERRKERKNSLGLSLAHLFLHLQKNAKKTLPLSFSPLSSSQGPLRRPHPPRNPLGPALPAADRAPLPRALPRALLPGSLLSVAEKACAARADSTLFPKNWIFHQRWDERSHKATHEGHGIRWIKVGGRTTAFCPGVQKKTDDGGGGEDGEEEEEEKETRKLKSKAAAASSTAATASKRKQPPPPTAKAGKRAKGAVAVPKAPPSRAAAPSARARALPRI